ncbi:NAD(P)(+) transhydrogenase (Re/Si-specific) subunit alpha, partial [Burkholderia sp. Bp8963]
MIGVPVETRPGETRVAATPETIKKYMAAGHRVSVAKGAGVAASYPDDAYAAAGAELTDQSAAFAADIVLKVQAPTDAEMASLKRGSVLIGMLEPFNTEQA